MIVVNHIADADCNKLRDDKMRNTVSRREPNSIPNPSPIPSKLFISSSIPNANNTQLSKKSNSNPVDGMSNHANVVSTAPSSVWQSGGKDIRRELKTNRAKLRAPHGCSHHNAATRSTSGPPAPAYTSSCCTGATLFFICMQ